MSLLHMRGQLSSGVSVVMCCIKVAAYVHVHLCRHGCIPASAGAGAGTYMQVQVHLCRLRCGCIGSCAHLQAHTCRCICAGAGA